MSDCVLLVEVTVAGKSANKISYSLSYSGLRTNNRSCVLPVRNMRKIHLLQGIYGHNIQNSALSSLHHFFGKEEVHGFDSRLWLQSPLKWGDPRDV